MQSKSRSPKWSRQTEPALTATRNKPAEGLQAEAPTVAIPAGGGNQVAQSVFSSGNQCPVILGIRIPRWQAITVFFQWDPSSTARFDEFGTAVTEVDDNFNGFACQASASGGNFVCPNSGSNIKVAEIPGQHQSFRDEHGAIRKEQAPRAV